MEKKYEEMSILELKATLFDIDQEIKMKQHLFQHVAMIFQEKMNKLQNLDNKEKE